MNQLDKFEENGQSYSSSVNLDISMNNYYLEHSKTFSERSVDGHYREVLLKQHERPNGFQRSSTFYSKFNKNTKNNSSPKLKYFNFEISNSQLNKINISIESNKTGLELLLEVCDYFKIQEHYYFGLCFDSKNLFAPNEFYIPIMNNRKLKTNTWINCRNKLSDTFAIFDVDSSSCESLLKLEFNMKFFPDPYGLFLSSTKNEIYYNLKRIYESRIMNDINMTSNKKHLLDALIAHVEINNEVTKEDYYLEKLHSTANFNQTLKVIEKHKELLKMTKEQCQWRFVIECSTLSNYGVEVFIDVEMVTDMNEKISCNVLINKNRIQIVNSMNNQLIKCLMLDQLSTATLNEKKVVVTDINYEETDRDILFFSNNINESANVNQDYSNMKKIILKLSTENEAMNLYRCITEYHTFFHCDHIKQEIKEQKFTASFLKKTMGNSHLFNNTYQYIKNCIKKTDFGRKLSSNIDKNDSFYVFDCMSTLNEIQNVLKKDTKFLSGLFEGKFEEKYCIETTQLSITCIICREATINCLIEPCCHLIGCERCIHKCDKCPLCRSPIQSKKIVFIPV